MSASPAEAVALVEAGGNESTTAVPKPSDLAVGTRLQILLYLGALVILLGFGAPGGGLIGLPISFILKNKLHLRAHQTALFLLIASAPIYLSVVFGFLRDRFSPFGMKDRGFMLLFGGICALVYLYFGLTSVSYVSLLIAIILVRVAFLFVSSAQSGLSSAIGQQHVMSGQVSAAWNIFGSFPGIAALLLGGSLSDLLEGRNAEFGAHVLFLTGAAIMAAVALFGLWKPAAVFDSVAPDPPVRVSLLQDLRRVAGHWPVYPALLIWMLWNFAPGSATPLQYYLQDTLHAKDAQWAQFNAIFSISFLPTFMIFGVLCRKYPLRKLLFWGTLVAVPQMVPLLFIPTINAALIAAVPIGLMGGVATAAYTDLLIRSCPPGLQGTVLMMSVALYEVAQRFGDLLGTNLYDRFGGFKVCVIAITVVYALILPVLLLIPKSLIATADGEVPAAA